MFYSKITLTINHDISQSGLNTKIDFPIHCSLYNQRYLLQVTKNNLLVNSRPETILFLVKHVINEQGASKLRIEMLLCHIALCDLTLTLNI